MYFIHFVKYFLKSYEELMAAGGAGIASRHTKNYKAGACDIKKVNIPYFFSGEILSVEISFSTV